MVETNKQKIAVVSAELHRGLHQRTPGSFKTSQVIPSCRQLYLKNSRISAN